MVDDTKPRDDESGAAAVDGVLPSPIEATDQAASLSSVAPQPQAEDELSRLLREFDEGTKLGLPPEPQEQQRTDPLDEINQILDEPPQPPVDALTQQQFEQQSRDLQQLREKQFWEGEDRAFEQVASADQKEFEQEFDHIDKDYIAKELKLLAMENERFRNCWFGRGRDPSSWRAAHRIVLRQLHRECEQRQAVIAGRQVAADREMVAASMKGSGAKMNVAEAAPWFGGMSDAELREYTRRNFGF
jgi:hypothetical protein